MKVVLEQLQHQEKLYTWICHGYFKLILWQILKWRPEGNSWCGHWQEESYFLFYSLAWLKQQGQKTHGSKKAAMATKEYCIIAFNVLIPFQKGLIYAKCFKQSSKIAAISMMHDKEMNIHNTFALLGYHYKETAKATAKALEWMVT